jgi:hypothetical protein
MARGLPGSRIPGASQIRIGVNLRDIIKERRDICGDDVNVAARPEDPASSTMLVRGIESALPNRPSRCSAHSLWGAVSRYRDHPPSSHLSHLSPVRSWLPPRCGTRDHGARGQRDDDRPPYPARRGTRRFARVPPLCGRVVAYWQCPKRSPNIPLTSTKKRPVDVHEDQPVPRSLSIDL